MTWLTQLQGTASPDDVFPAPGSTKLADPPAGTRCSHTATVQDS
jgi:hypothetical protein